MRRVIAWRTWASRRVDGPVRSMSMRWGRAHRVAMGVQAAHREVPIVEVHSDNPTPRPNVAVRFTTAGLRWGCPRGGQIPASPAGFSGDAVGHRTSARDPGQPLLSAVARTPPCPRARNGHVAVLARCSKGLGSRRLTSPSGVTVMVRFPNGSSPEPIASIRLRDRSHVLPPLGLGQACGVEVVAGLGQPFTAFHHTHPPVLEIGW